MTELIELLAPAVLALAIVRLLVARPPAPTKLPDPSKLGMPTAGPATPAQVHQLLRPQPARRWWRFWI
jgi:hypothetical protein